ncbi:MAG: hypothetical protein M1836_002788 [Candelina mexicana]|nr:MAG: hypothetical protein M1836_002788 [Candelina mexicana]
MSSPRIGTLTQLWSKWKTLRLPWRKQYLAGMDLAGNTYWEFRDQLNATRYRRIVKYNPKTHYADVKIAPQWHQWLKQVRPDPPSIPEQRADLQRQANMKQLAQRADERWASKPSFLDKPKEQPVPATLPRDPAGYAGQTEPDEKEGVRNAIGSPEDIGRAAGDQNTEKDPWEQAKRRARGPSEGWQPQEWTPGPARKR